MCDILKHLKPKERRGSKVRCHLLTKGSPEKVAERLTNLIKPCGMVTPNDRWMPQGFSVVEEAQLHKAPRLIDVEVGKKLRAWWLAVYNSQAMTPNWDIASTCTIEDKPGLLLVEAKAHDEELNKESAGKKLKQYASENSKANHEKIGAAILSASHGFHDATSLKWQISRDSHYQMSNRFAWSWKLTELGFPVVLVYLGFLKAEEMKDQGKPFTDHTEWERVVKSHSKPLFPAEVWNRKWTLHWQPFMPLIRSIEQQLKNVPQEERL